MKKLLLFLFLYLFLCNCATATIKGPFYDEGKEFGEKGYPSITYSYKGAQYRWYNPSKSFEEMHMEFYRCKAKYFTHSPKKGTDFLDVNDCMESLGYTQTRPDLLDEPIFP